MIFLNRFFINFSSIFGFPNASKIDQKSTKKLTKKSSSFWCDFWSIFARFWDPKWGPKSAQNRPIQATNGSQSALGAKMSPRPAQESLGNGFWTNLDRFLVNFAPIFNPYWMIFDQFWIDFESVLIQWINHKSMTQSAKQPTKQPTAAYPPPCLSSGLAVGG